MWHRKNRHEPIYDKSSNTKIIWNRN